MDPKREPDHELSLLLSAMLDGQMTAAEESRLAGLLRDNPNAQEVYLDCCRTHALLRQELGGRCDIASLAGEGEAGSIGDMSSPLADGQSASVPFPSIILQPSSHPAPLFSPLGSFVFSYSLAALIVGIGMLIGWACKVSVQEQVAKAPPPAVVHPEPEMVFVGRVTGMVDCRWSDSSTGTVSYAYVPLGRRYALASGLMEITYDTGTTVILEGPCTYTVESKTSGFLGIGRLTAKVEERGERRGERKTLAAGQQTVNSNRKSAAPLATLPPSLVFVVRTPTATVTDLGTEFGVAVDESGQTESHVFRGRVLLAAVDSSGRRQGRNITLTANESARVEKAGAGEGFVARRTKITVQAASFVRGDQFAARAKEARELPLKPFRNWQAFSDQLRKRGDLLAYYDFQRDRGDPRDGDGYELLRNRAGTGSKFDGRLVGSIKMGMARGRFPGKDALQFTYPGDGVRINIPGSFPRMTLVASFSLDRCNGLAGIIMSDDWDRAGQLHWQFVNAGTIKFALPPPDSAYQLDVREAGEFNRWHSWATVYDAPGSRVAWYVDGRLLHEWTMTKASNIRIIEATIGNWKPWAYGGPRPLGGSIDEVAIFSGVLSEAEIKQLHEGGNGVQQK
jgi:hypothetical protein